jgi:MFS family permease
VVLGLGVHSILYGAIDVLAVVIAVDQLRRPEAFAGWVTAAFGAGMLVAGLVSFAVLGQRRLAPGIIAAAVGVGASLALVSLADRRAAAVLVLMGACGLSASLYELTSRMLLQRISGLDVLGHVFSLVEAVQMAMLAVGSASVPFVVHALGTRWAPAGVGALMVLTIAILGPALVRVDRRAHVPLTEMAALRATPLLAPLPAPALETLAREARRQEIPAGAVVVGRGEPGSDYYAIVSGRLHVVTGDRTVVRLSRGDGFGEIALLHGTSRTATVHAVEPSVVLAVGRDAFLTAVSGHAATLEKALAIADRWSG